MDTPSEMIVAYRGDPSWVFVSIRAQGVRGSIRCQIEMENGQTEAAGALVVQNGVGDWARPTPVDVDRIRGATLVTSQGSALATASFTES
jgi:regulation of enolase protein 1 (concanavalin A-like superfamily)